jgi:hypothetical protein
MAFHLEVVPPVVGVRQDVALGVDDLLAADLLDDRAKPDGLRGREAVRALLVRDVACPANRLRGVDLLGDGLDELG